MGQPVGDINLRALWCEKTTGHRFEERGEVRTTLWFDAQNQRQIISYECWECHQQIVQKEYSCVSTSWY